MPDHAVRIKSLWSCHPFFHVSFLHIMSDSNKPSFTDIIRTFCISIPSQQSPDSASFLLWCHGYKCLIPEKSICIFYYKFTKSFIAPDWDGTPFVIVAVAVNRRTEVKMGVSVHWTLGIVACRICAIFKQFLNNALF